MNKRTLLAIFIAFVVTIGATAVWSASTLEREGDTDANMLEDSGSLAGNVDDNGEVKAKKKGNKVVRVIAAPFKAFGRLFKRNNDNKLQRMTEKDAEKFADSRRGHALKTAARPRQRSWTQRLRQKSIWQRVAAIC